MNGGGGLDVEVTPERFGFYGGTEGSNLETTPTNVSFTRCRKS